MIKLGGPTAKPPKLISYPSYGFKTSSGDWLINLVGCVFYTPPFNLRQKMLIKMLANVMKASDADLASPIFHERIGPFFIDAQRGQKMQAEIGGKSFLIRRKSRRNGHFNSWLRLDESFVKSVANVDKHANKVLDARLMTSHSACEPASCQILLMKPKGLSIVSDIDDTIKDSLVTNRRELLMNTFIREFRSVEGMSDVYNDWASVGADFHYVSSSPWQLFNSLNRMRSEFKFPIGSMHLRNFRLRDQFLKKLLFRRKGKATEIRRLVKNLPERKFILVGDSGEKDPEIYQKICRKYPEQIKGVFIREIAGREMIGDRMGKLKRCVGHNICGVFTDSGQLKNQAESIFEKYGRSLVPN